MSDMFGFDAFSPSQIAQRVDQVGVIKARLPLLPLIMLGLLAGAFIGLGGMCFVLVKSDLSLGFAMGQLLGGMAFCLGLLLVVVAGAELFTGNNLLVMAWADGLITSKELLRNWLVVCLANFAGAAGLAVIVYLSGHPEMNDGAVAATYLNIAVAKSELSFSAAFFKGIMCNVLVCLAVWMAFAGRSVTDKAVAIVFPITAFVAAGFEHSVANMYFFPMAMLLEQDTGITGMEELISWSSFFGNLVPVILGNIIGGGVLVALVYHLIYGRNMMTKKP
ncbi:MAG: formate transporter [Paraglaciecola sp.]|jgi:formate transporter